MKVDYLIVGQGICGTFLSYFLMKRGKSVLVIDKPVHHSASRIASGVINPVTGRRIVKTWMIDELMAFDKEAYEAIGKLLNCRVLTEVNIIDFHASQQMQRAFEDRLLMDEAPFLSLPKDQNCWKNIFQYDFGFGEIVPAFWLNLTNLLIKWREFLQEKNAFIEAEFKYDEVDFLGEKVHWKGIEADKIICCDGVEATKSPWFSYLPFSPNKGEAIIAKIENLPTNFIYKKGLSIVPWHPDQDLFWIGSTYKWSFEDAKPTAEFRQQVEETLQNWLQLPYEIVDHLASVRPANTQRRPFVGILQQNPKIAILNGMGTKGCSLAPYFSQKLVELLLEDKPILPEADVNRFANKLKIDF